MIDTTPSITGTSGVARIYDLVMTHQLDADDFFIHRVQEHCAAAGLNFFLVEPLWAEAFLQNLLSGRVWARVLLNMHSEHHLPEELYHRLVRAAAERNVTVIDPPDVALAAFDKATLHPRLIGAGIDVPFTVIVPREQVAGFQLTPEDLAALGSPFVIKPGMGYGRRGVILEATTEKDLFRSVATMNNGHYLLQKRVVPRLLGERPAYFRAYFVFGSVWVCWWNCFTDHYAELSDADRQQFGLQRLEEIVRRIAALSGMNFFSSEIAVTGSNEFVAIDYVNDQCHLLTQSASPKNGVPDALVARIARRLVEAAASLASGRKPV